MRPSKRRASPPSTAFGSNGRMGRSCAKIPAQRVCWSTAANLICACWIAHGPWEWKFINPRFVRRQIWDGTRWRLTIDADGASEHLDADFVAYAGGRRNAAGRQIKVGPSTLAVYGYWRGASLPTHPRIEAGQDSWYWGVPLPDRTYNTLVFVDPAWFRSAPGSTISERFLRLIDRSNLMEGCRDVRADRAGMRARRHGLSWQ